MDLPCKIACCYEIENAMFTHMPFLLFSHERIGKTEVFYNPFCIRKLLSSKYKAISKNCFNKLHLHHKNMSFVFRVCYRNIFHSLFTKLSIWKVASAVKRWSRPLCFFVLSRLSTCSFKLSVCSPKLSACSTKFPRAF